MIRASVAAFVVALTLLSSSACGPTIDLSKAIEVTDVLGGYYDAGLKDGWNYLLPSLSFRLKNKDTRTLGPVQITVAFWKAGDEWDSVVLQGVHAAGLAGGVTTESLLARAKIGFRLEGARSDFFAHSMFQDVTAKVFASQAGRIYRLGEFKLEHLVIPHLNAD